jgi:1-deoxy-D-xylulose-5-phosphate synthase
METVSLLKSIASPADLRRLSDDQLPALAGELRQYIVDTISAEGGHFSSNLGTVELTIALHYVFDTPADRIVWDVGHQAYAHKVLTGRRERLSSIRKLGGLSGFTCRAESPHDAFGAGHASTSISAALGIAEGLRLKGDGRHMAIAVIGDGSLTGGLAFEGMNNAGHMPSRNLVVVLNDNAMSIDPNVGALSKFVNKAVIHPRYNDVRKEVRGLLEVLAHAGVPLRDAVSKLRRTVKSAFTPGILFECFGFRYLGPIDGHDLPALLEAFRFVRKEGHRSGPFFVHVLTKKGKGYAPAEENSLKYHGVTPFKADAGIVAGAPKKTAYQDVFADTLIRLAKNDERIVAITAAMPSGTGLAKFQKVIPERFFDVGIAEAHAVTFAAGLATEGLRPVAAIYSTFLQRAFDSVVHDVALQQLPVILAMDRAGLVGNDGATHQGAYDLSYLRVIPNVVLMAPKDENELQHMLKTCIDYTAGPTAVRYPRGEVVGVTMDPEPVAIPIGQGELLDTDGENVDVAFFAVGIAVQHAKEAVALLRRQGRRCAVVNARFVKPLDERLLTHWARHARLVVTVEENAVLGGFGSAVVELLQRHHVLAEVAVLGIPDRFVEHASPKEQRDLCGLTPPKLAEYVRHRLEETPTKPPAPRPRARERAVEPFVPAN